MLFVKRGDRVQEEAVALAAARHPGIVELVDATDGVLRTTHLRHACPLSEAGPLTADEVAGVVAAVATTLADLHERGVVHGGLDAGHVLVAADGQPVLCSLGRGGSPADDVLALATLATGVLAGASVRPPWAVGTGGTSWRAPLSGRRPAAGRGGRPRLTRWRRPRLGPMLAPDPAAALATVLAEVEAADPDARPTARALAAAIHQRVPSAHLPHPAGRPGLLLAAPRRAAGDPTAITRPGRPRATTSRRLVTGWVAAVVAGGAVLVVALAVVPSALRDRRPAAEAAWPAAQGPSSPSSRNATAGATRPAGPSSSGTTIVASAPAPLAVRVWPAEPLDFRDGILSIDGARYALGRPGDAVVAGDWHCTGRRTVALFRPRTGEVFAFAGWPADGEAATARPLGTVAGATGVRVVDADGDGCDDLELARAGAGPVHLAPAR